MESPATEANRLKQIAGSELKSFLEETFKGLVAQEIIQDFSKDENFSHVGFSYKKQYLANFVLKTLDNKFIVINSSSSYRHDRMKGQSYDLEGVTKNAIISDNIIASILLYPDSELDNTSLRSYRNDVYNKNAYSPASHMLVVSELINFLENHKNLVIQENLKIQEENELLADENKKIGSYYGLRGNAFERDVVSVLNNGENLNSFISKSGSSDSEIFNKIINKICGDNNIMINDILNVFSTNTVIKLKSGGNAKTDIIVEIKTTNGSLKQTISVKNTTKSIVSCHDYKCIDFIRVLGIEGTRLSEYFKLYQRSGSHERFVSCLPRGMSSDEFTELLTPYRDILMNWALTGKHDCDNLIDPDTQVSNYLLINKAGEIRFIDFRSYIDELYKSGRKLVYGIPLRWTHPSKQRGVRIQLKLPILV